jgi:hypothetical protein
VNSFQSLTVGDVGAPKRTLPWLTGLGNYIVIEDSPSPQSSVVPATVFDSPSPAPPTPIWTGIENYRAAQVAQLRTQRIPLAPLGDAGNVRLLTANGDGNGDITEARATTKKRRLSDRFPELDHRAWLELRVCLLHLLLILRPKSEGS